jgi:hypothetical protein
MLEPDVSQPYGLPRPLTGTDEYVRECEIAEVILVPFRFGEQSWNLRKRPEKYPQCSVGDSNIETNPPLQRQ